MDNRIYFKNNPWPEGHAVKNFAWTAEVRDGMVWFHFHLETDDYYANVISTMVKMRSTTATGKRPSSGATTTGARYRPMSGTTVASRSAQRLSTLKP